MKLLSLLEIDKAIALLMPLEAHAELRPIVSTKQLRPFGLCVGEFTVPDNFDAPLPEDLLSTFWKRLFS